MHELGIMYRVLDIALDVANKNNGREITGIDLEIGVMSGIVPRYAQKFFVQIAKGTIAENAQLHFKDIPANFVCRDCRNAMIITRSGTEFFCDRCGSPNLSLDSGMGFRMASVAIV